MMEALRGAVGPDIEVMVDFHGRPARAPRRSPISRRWSRGARCSWRNRATGRSGAYAKSRRNEVPLATGERLIDRAEFDDLLAARAVGIVQPDICHCGGC